MASHAKILTTSNFTLQQQKAARKRMQLNLSLLNIWKKNDPNRMWITSATI